MWREDFNGTRTCYWYFGHKEVVRIEGLSKDASCSAPMLLTGSRRVTTEWHPDWQLQTRVAEPGRITTKVYNGQPDPFNGNALASCAPNTAKLLDNKPIVVLCKQIVQATTDADGSDGVWATVDSTVPARVEEWTYNEFGQVLTHDGPLLGTGDVTTYEYYPSTDVDWTKGDLKLVRNAANHTVSYPKYNKAGKPLQMVDANGVVTDYTYDLRQRLTSVTTAGQTTTYEYFPTGLLKQITQPDNSFVAYEYDDAQRQIAVRDHLGNRIDYVLDNMGNRTAEQVKDPGGALRRSVTRVFDALGRVEQTTGRE